MPTATLGAGAGITPVQNVWYTVLDTINNVRIKTIQPMQTSTEAAVETIGCRVTVDGIVMANAESSTGSGVKVAVRLTPTADSFTTLTVPSFNAGTYVDFTGKRIKIEAAQSTAVGTNPLLFCSVQYEQMAEVT